MNSSFICCVCADCGCGRAQAVHRRHRMWPLAFHSPPPLSLSLYRENKSHLQHRPASMLIHTPGISSEDEFSLNFTERKMHLQFRSAFPLGCRCICPRRDKLRTMQTRYEIKVEKKTITPEIETNIVQTDRQGGRCQ